MSLEVDVVHRQGDFRLAVRFAGAGRLIVLAGPSGAGKTTLLNIIAGLIKPDRGRVAVAGTVLVDCAQGIFLPPRRRRLGYVFQDGRLFPHMSVRQNLRYGQVLTPRRDRFIGFDEVVVLLGLGALMDRRPGRLSGGEQQRVAIGRALLTSPRLLLMDEPLASLDRERRDEILPYIERLRDQARVPIVYVTHAADEAARLATDTVRLEAGRVAQAGSPQGPAPAIGQRSLPWFA